MSRRKGELSKVTIDRDFPYQVALPEACVVANFESVRGRASELGVCSRGFGYHQNDGHHVVYCFPTEDAGNAFWLEFGGKKVAPKRSAIVHVWGPARPKWPAG